MPENSPNEENAIDSDSIESKSQRKRNARQITVLASDLIEMKPRVLASLPLTQSVREAITQCAEITAHGARKRQLHYVSKLLRESENVEEIYRIVNRPDLLKTSSAVNPHQAFRDKLMADFGEHVDQLRSDYPTADLQQVRQLVRNALNEHEKANAQNDDEHKTAVNINSTKSAKALLKLLAKSQ